MELASKVRSGKDGKRSPRTVVAHNSSAAHAGWYGWDVLSESFARFKSHVPTRIKLIGSRLIQPKVMVVFGVIALAFLSLGVYYYNIFSREIDERLEVGFFDNAVGIFSSPFKVSVGDKLPIEELSQYLEAAGYQQRQDEDGQGALGTYWIDGNDIEIRPARKSAIRLGLYPVRLEIDKNGKIASLTSPINNKKLSSAEIEGELLASVENGDRRKKTSVRFSDIPANLRDAMVAVEDRRFFSHGGIDWRGIARALWQDIHEGEIVQGGSTITQQLIKNAVLTSDRTLTRKLKEASMAVILESRLSKQEIFTLYFNNVYLGQNGTFAIHGFAEAAQVYFGKQLSDLTLSESAFLAGLIHAPNRYTLHRDMKLATERRNDVLDAMVSTGAITSEQSEAAKTAQIALKERTSQDSYGTNYFIDYAQRFTEDRYGDTELASRRINTTMDPRLQRAAYEAVTNHAAKLDKVLARSTRKGGESPRVQAALVAIDAHTGEVLAMVGGRNYAESQLNRATDARRQPGSSFKPFVYASALSMRSYTPATLLSDRPQTFSYDGGREEYNPNDYHGGFTNRDVTLREALTRSLNVPAVELALRVGLGGIADVAEECGLDRPRTYPSMALGTSEATPLQMAGAYTAFANQGLALRPIPIKDISAGTANENSRPVSATSVRVFSQQVAYIVTDFLESVVNSGTAAHARAMGVKGAAAGKTGTSRDGWFVGYTPNMVCAVWVGFDDNRDLGLKASESALPIWADFVKEATEIRHDLGGDSFARPGGITSADIDPTTGLLAGPECPSHRKEIFISGTEPYSMCSHQQEAYLDEGLYPDSYDMDNQGWNYTDPNQDSKYDYSKITLDVCARTGLIATPYCPNVEKRTYKLGHEPLDMCNLHTYATAAIRKDEGGNKRGYDDSYSTPRDQQSSGSSYDSGEADRQDEPRGQSTKMSPTMIKDGKRREQKKESPRNESGSAPKDDN